MLHTDLDDAVEREIAAFIKGYSLRSISVLVTAPPDAIRCQIASADRSYTTVTIITDGYRSAVSLQQLEDVYG